MNDLVVFGGPVPTYLIESIQAQLKPSAALPHGVQAIRFTGVTASATADMPESILTALANEQLDWAYEVHQGIYKVGGADGRAA